MFQKLWKVLTDPSNEIKGLKARDLGEGAKAVAYGAVIAAIGSAVISLLTASVLPFFGGPAVAVLNAVGAFVMAFVGWLLGGVVVYAVARVLGSKVTPTDTLANYGYLSGALLLVTWIPLIGLLASIYGLYLLYLFFQYVTGLNKDKAVLGVMIVVVVSLVIWGAVAALAYMWTLGTVGAQYGMHRPY